MRRFKIDNKAITLVVFLLSILVNYFVWNIINNYVNNRTRVRFDSRTDLIQSTIKGSLNDFQDILFGAKGLVNASDSVTRQEWKQYVDSLKIEENSPGL